MSAAKMREPLKIFVGRIGMIILALLFAAIFLKTSGYPPSAVVRGIFLSLTRDIAGTVRWAAPLILSGLAVCVTYKAEIYNLGVDGQLYMGSAAAAATALSLPDADPFLSSAVVFAAAMAAGMLFALIPALLKVYLDTNEVVSTMLLNFIAALYVDYLVTGPLRDTSAGANLNASPIIPQNTWLPRISYLAPSSANVGFYIALIVAAVIAFMFKKTTLGYEIKIVGANSQFASYGGVSPRRTTLQVMGLSGAIAGIAGAIEVSAVQHRLLSGFNPDFGFDGIVVSLLANHNPAGVVFSGLVFGALKYGGANMERATDVPSAVTRIVMAIIILSISARIALPKLRQALKKSAKGGDA
jgi:simple sugar transport system permease protein